MIAIIASLDVPTSPEVITTVVTALVAHDDDIIIVRADRSGNINSPVEQMVSRIAEQLGKDVLAMRNDGTKRGRNQTFERDRSIVTVVDKVVAFFNEGSLSGGTGNIIRMALEEKYTEVEAYSVNFLGMPTLVGHDSGDPRPYWGRWSSNEVLKAMWKESQVQ
jgi:hypothetical protein